jgi:oxidase EvaA
MRSETLRGWLKAARAACDMRVEEIPWARSRQWRFEEGKLRHGGGAFFSVVGAALSAQGERQHRFDQPLIDQPEVGILGFLVRQGREGTEFLVQAKPEPGNQGLVQAAPTVQATESNYRRRHGGKATPCLERFLQPHAALSSSLQSEQGTRFLGKYNRNTVVAANGVAETAALRWFPAPDLREALLLDFEVNTDARSVLASGPWELLAPEGTPFARWRGQGGIGEDLLRSFEADEPLGSVAGHLDRLRAAAETEVSTVELSDLSGWEVTDQAILGRDFSVRQFAVTTSEREVASWDQPLVASAAEGRAVLLCREHEGVLRFLFRARPEIGFRERLQFGPTFQDGPPAPPIPDEGRVLLSTLHSEEGGRFYRCVHRYTIRRLEGDAPGDGDVVAMTLGQVRRLIRRPGFFTNEARTLVSMLLSYA